jgi:hypothetical protein
MGRIEQIDVEWMGTERIKTYYRAERARDFSEAGAAGR